MRGPATALLIMRGVLVDCVLLLLLAIASGSETVIFTFTFYSTETDSTALDLNTFKNLISGILNLDSDQELVYTTEPYLAWDTALSIDLDLQSTSRTQSEIDSMIETVADYASQGSLSSYSIFKFNYVDICEDEYYGISCDKLCGTCDDGKICSDGALGTGECYYPYLAHNFVFWSLDGYINLHSLRATVTSFLGLDRSLENLVFFENPFEAWDGVYELHLSYNTSLVDVNGAFDSFRIEELGLRIRHLAKQGIFEEYSIFAFDYTDVCGSGFFGMRCQYKCPTCPIGAQCIDGALGSGFCVYTDIAYNYTFTSSKTTGFNTESFLADIHSVLTLSEFEDMVYLANPEVIADKLEVILSLNTSLRVDGAFDQTRIEEIGSIIRSSLTSGSFDDYDIVLFDGSDLCIAGDYGPSCASCTCPTGTSCSDGYFGDGVCTCEDTVIYGDFEVTVGQITGRCLLISSQAVDLGDIQTGSTLLKSLSFKSVGTEPLPVDLVSLSDHSNFDLSFTPAMVDFRGEYLFEVSISPLVPDQITATIDITLGTQYSGQHARTTLPNVVQITASAVGLTKQSSDPVNIWRVNCGERIEQYTDSQGTVWINDIFNTTGFYSNGDGGVVEESWRTGLSDIYLVKRKFGATPSGYQLATRDTGKHIVTLYFIATDSTTRTFEVAVEGQTRSINVFEEAGGFDIPYVVEFNVDAVYDSYIDIVFAPSGGDAMINGIAIDWYPNTVSGVETFDYGKALHLMYLFLQISRSGALPYQRVGWRSDSNIDNVGKYGEDVSAGYFEAGGSYLKLSGHTASSLGQYAWNLIQFKSGHEKVNEYDEGLEAMRWGLEYFINCHTQETRGELVAGVGVPGYEFSFWGPPEATTYPKPVQYVTQDAPATEITGATSAFLSMGYILFKDYDPDFAAECLVHATDLYEFAMTYQRSYMDDEVFADQGQLYPSTGFYDEQVWAAYWLFKATGNLDYLETAERVYNENVLDYGGWAYDWNEKLPALNVLLAFEEAVVNNSAYLFNVYDYFNRWMDTSHRDVDRTPKGFPYRFYWGSTRYAGNSAFLALVTANHVEASDPVYASELRKFSKDISDYILGKGTGSPSYLIGYGDNYASYIFHKSSFFPYTLEPNFSENSYTSTEFYSEELGARYDPYGALMPGPIDRGVGRTDWHYKDTRKGSWVYTEPTLDMGMGLTGVFAGLIELHGGESFSDCELNLGWGDPNTNAPPSWPDDDCYHQCCTSTP